MTHTASGYRSSASAGNLLVTAHVLISLSLSLAPSFSLSLRMRRTRARATRVRSFRFACRNILNSLSNRIIKAARARANLLRTRRESRERLVRAYSRPFNKIDGHPPHVTQVFFNHGMRSINYRNREVCHFDTLTNLHEQWQSGAR